MILASSLLKLQNNEFAKTFEIAIQLGAILAIVYLYAKRLLNNRVLYKKLAVAFLPAALVGFTAYKAIKAYLFNAGVVSAALIIGGIILILLDKKVVNNSSKHIEMENISYKNAFLIGIFQSISVIPGVSRAAATIIGGIFNGYDKRQATEFSFLLAVPTMFAATGYDLLKTKATLNVNEFGLLAVGGIVSFIFAWLAVKLFLNLINKHGFMIFGYYRIILGLLFIAVSKYIF